MTVHGVLCVMIIGTTQILLWCVESWDTPLKVSSNHYIFSQTHFTITLPTDAVSFSSAHFGAGRGPIHLYNCTGRESRLVDCSRVSFNRYYKCRSHFEDAGVRCQGRFLYLSDYSISLMLCVQYHYKIVFIHYSQLQWQLYIRRYSSGGRLQSV